MHTHMHELTHMHSYPTYIQHTCKHIHTCTFVFIHCMLTHTTLTPYHPFMCIHADTCAQSKEGAQHVRPQAAWLYPAPRPCGSSLHMERLTAAVWYPSVLWKHHVPGDMSQHGSQLGSGGCVSTEALKVYLVLSVFGLDDEVRSLFCQGI